jgi:hypothetical protein
MVDEQNIPIVDEQVVTPVTDKQVVIPKEQIDIRLEEQPIDASTVAPMQASRRTKGEYYFNPYTVITIYDRSFWDLWIQKMFRNIGSMKCQFLWAFFWTVIYGMFIGKDSTGANYISPTLGLGFLSGGFITLVTAKLAVKTSLFESPSDPLDSDN